MNRISHETWSTIIGTVYLGLMTNLLLAVGCLPLIALLLTTDPTRSWALLAVAAPLCGPAIVAAFATFRAHTDGDASVVWTFVRAWKSSARRSLGVAATVIGFAVVLLVDVRVLADTPVAVVCVPVLLVLLVVASCTGLVALTAVSEDPKLPLKDTLRFSLYLGVWRWYLSLVSLGVLAVQAALFTAKPAIALGLTAAPALYLVWANSRYALRSVPSAAEVAAWPSRNRSGVRGGAQFRSGLALVARPLPANPTGLREEPPHIRGHQRAYRLLT